MVKNKRWVLYILISVIIAIVLLFTLKKDIKISNISWILDGNKCNVSFKVYNPTHKPLSALITIYAYSQAANLSPAVRAGVVTLLGSKQIELKLDSFTSKFIQETVEVITPDVVKVDVMPNQITSLVLK